MKSRVNRDEEEHGQTNQNKVDVVWRKVSPPPHCCRRDVGAWKSMMIGRGSSQSADPTSNHLPFSAGLPPHTVNQRSDPALKNNSSHAHWIKDCSPLAKSRHQSHPAPARAPADPPRPILALCCSCNITHQSITSPPQPGTHPMASPPGSSRLRTMALWRVELRIVS